MFTVFSFITTGNKQVINVGKHKIKAAKDMVDETLESLHGVTQTEWHAQKLEQAKRSGDDHLWNILLHNWNLVESANKIDGGENCLAMQSDGAVVNMRDWIAIWYSNVVQTTVIAAQVPVAMDFGIMCKGIAQMLSDGWMMPNCSMCSNSALAMASFSGPKWRGQAKVGSPVVLIWWTMYKWVDFLIRHDQMEQLQEVVQEVGKTWPSRWVTNAKVQSRLRGLLALIAKASLVVLKSRLVDVNFKVESV